MGWRFEFLCRNECSCKQIRVEVMGQLGLIGVY